MDLNGFRERSLSANIQHITTMVPAMGRHWLRRLRHGDQAFVRILYHSPTILLLPYHGKDLTPLHQAIGNSPSYFLFNFWGTIELPGAIKAIRSREDKRKRTFPQHNYIYLCNTLEELRLIQDAGMEGIFCNHNGWIDETIFCLEPVAEKCYDAVYDANLAPYKRHKLAAQIDNLALISFRHPVLFDRPYARGVRQCLTHAHWFNDPLSQDYRYFSTEEVAQVLRQSRVGLCLSASEGAMYASIQYLLCGLPVVSTASKGGRDVFFEPDFVKIVSATQEAVRAGVQELLKTSLPPGEIRARTLKKIQKHRQRFQDLLQIIHDRHATGVMVSEDWPSLFQNKMGLTEQSLREIAVELRNPRN